MNLQPGNSVLEIGCSSGANFSFLHNQIGETGEIMGVDLSPDMIRQAEKRIMIEGWQNISVKEGMAEVIDLEKQYDGLLLFAMHDVLTSKDALDNILKFVKTGGAIVAAGPKLPSKYPGKILQPMIKMVFNQFAVSGEDKEQPWRILGERVKKLRVEENRIGTMYIADGKV